MTAGVIAITEGSGKNLNTETRTRDAVTVEDQYVLLGEPGEASYTALAPGILTTTSASHLVQLMADGTNYTRVRFIEVQQAVLSGAATTIYLQVFRVTTAGTGGGAITARPLDTGDTNGYAGTVLTLNSSKGTEGNQLLQQRLVMETTQPTKLMNTWTWVADLHMKPILIQPAVTNGIVIKIVTGLATSQVDMTIGFTTTTF